MTRVWQSLAIKVCVTLIAAGCATAQTTPSAKPRQPYSGGTVVTYDQPRIADGFDQTTTGVVWNRQFGSVSYKYLSIHFKDVVSPQGADYRVVISLASGNRRVLASLSPAAFAAKSTSWSEPFVPGLVTVQVVANTPVKGLSFEIDQIAFDRPAQGSSSQTLAVVPVWDDVRDLQDAAPMVDIGRTWDAVAMLTISGRFHCSAFLISRDKVLTNFHCLNASATFQNNPGAHKANCGDIYVQFDFNSEAERNAAAHSSCVTVEDLDQTLDAAVLTLDPAAIRKNAGERVPVSWAAASPAKRSRVFIVHHPVGDYKRVSLDCASLPRDGRLDHNCSTLGGSSGSPVFDMKGNVIGLHFAGAYDETDDCQAMFKQAANGYLVLNSARSVENMRKFVSPYIGK